MNDPIPKRLEIAFRRFFIRALKAGVRRSAGPLQGVDFNRSKFLFIRQDMIGDVLVSTPLFAAIKTRYPDATLDVVLSPKNSIALVNSPHIRRKWIYSKSLGPAVQLVRALRLERYDFVVDLMDNPSATATAICLMAGARWNVGIEKDNAYAYDIQVPLLSRKDRHIIERLAQLLVPFGIDPASVDLRPEYRPSEEAAFFADRFWESEGLAGKKVVGINISAGTDVRFWGIANFRSLIGLIRHDYPSLRIVITYKPSDAQRARTIAESSPQVLVSPETLSFDHFAAIIRRLNFLVTPDTSAVHLASAYRIPSVVLYVQSDPNLRIWDPYHTPCRTIVTPVDDLKTIQPERVHAAAKELLTEMNIR